MQTLAKSHPGPSAGRRLDGASAERRPRRGVALLLVMIGLVVCSLLTAGFLASQGTSIGIARNERDAEKARAVAQSGIDLSYWLMRNRSDWRTFMSPGTWLNGASVGDGTVTVVAASGDGTSSFANDTTQPVVLTSTGTVAGRIFTLTATIGPTGGGTVFRGGNFCNGRITLGTGDLNGSAVIDSYDSSVAPYNSLFPGSNALFGTNGAFSGNYGLLVYFLSTYRGSFVGGSKQILANAAYQTSGAIGPASTAVNAQPYSLGTVIAPNTAGLTPLGPFARSSNGTLNTPGKYDSITLNANGSSATTTSVSVSGTYYISGNLTINSLANLAINDGVNALFVVDGNFTLSGNIKFSGSGTLSLYVNGNTTLNNAAAINLVGQNTSNFTLLGTGSGSITLNNNSQVYGAIYAPKSSVVLQNSTPKVYGAIISNDLTLLNSAAFHFDENLKTKRIDNITGGSAPQGIAEYNVTLVGAH